MRPRSSRSILLSFAVASLLVLSACGNQTQPRDYGEQYEKNFLFGCHEQVDVPDEDPDVTTLGPQAATDYCQCVYDGLEKKVPFDQAKSFEEQQAEEKAGEIEVPKAIQSVIDSCTKAS